MKSIKEICNDKLTALEKNLTADDKQAAMAHCNISRPTLDKYLNGDVAKIDTATSLVAFLGERVNQRMRELKLSNV